MRQALALVLMMTLLLAACSASAGDTEKFVELRERVTLGKITAKVEIRADFGNKTQSYTIEYSQNGESARMGILEPELLRGITARVEGTDSSVEFDGLILDTGELDGNGLTPVSALPAIIESIKNGHIEAVWREKDGELERIVFDLTVTDETGMNLWIDADSMVPQYAEIRYGERVVITCVFLEWSA